jgi:tetratricopeptide (TPR) repeat protein
MLIGADFFLSHHVYVANGQHKMYFSYNGGPVFNLKPVLAGAPTSADGATVAAPPDAQAPQYPAESAAGTGTAPADLTRPPAASTEVHTNAAEAADAERRGQALASRQQFDQALTALTLACQLAPEQPDYAYQRGMVYWQSKQSKLALADFDRALELQPNHVGALLARADMRIQNGESSGAAADLGVVGATVAKEDAVRASLAFDYDRLDLLLQAIEQYDLWIAAHPADVRLPGELNGRCRARALSGSDLPLALADCNEALKHAAKSSPFFAEISDSRALVLLRLGRYDKSIADFDASLKIEAKDAWSLYGRGLAEMRTNQAPDGHADIAKAQALSPKITDRFAKFGLLP